MHKFAQLNILYKFLIITLFIFCTAQWPAFAEEKIINGWGEKIEEVGLETKGLKADKISDVVADQITKYANKIEAKEIKIYQIGGYTYANFIIPVGSETHVFDSSGKKLDYASSIFDEVREAIDAIFRGNQEQFIYVRVESLK